MALLPGHATPDGTRRLAERHTVVRDHDGYRVHDGRHLSTVGIGTYLGETDRETQERYARAIATALASGINVVDTAINYRHTLSERAVRDAVTAGVEEGAIARDEVFVSTKGGYLAYDATVADPREALHEAYFRTGILTPQNLVADSHSLDPAYLAAELDRSRHHLNLETVDLYYLHNPGTQGGAVDREVLLERVQAAFRMLEDAAADGKLVSYGIATWNELRVPPGSDQHIPLQTIVALAEAAAADAGHATHRFRAVQAPLNLAMAEAVRTPTQEVDGERVALLEVCRRLGLGFFSSASILQGRLAKGLPAEVHTKVPGVEDPAMVALQATRSAPGLTSALVGMSRIGHVGSAVELLRAHRPDAHAVWS